MKTLSLDIGKDGVAVITMDAPGQPVNTFNAEFLADLREVVQTIESSEAVKAVVLISGKPAGFHAGADLKLLSAGLTADAITELSRESQRLRLGISEQTKPFVAAIHGPALGGGLELAMWCHARVATDHKKTKLGLPEVQLGLIPASGGTQLLPRQIGLQAALDMILTGRQITARKARSLGLVDEVVPPPLLARAAHDLALGLAERHHEKTPLEKMSSALTSFFSEDIQELLLEDNPIGRKVLFDQAKKQVLSRTHGNYPAPLEAIECVRIGASEGLEKGLEAEAQAFGRLATTPQARELVRVFLASTEMKKDTGVDAPDIQPRRVDKVGVLGAGLMGAGIAYVTVDLAGIPVRIKDRDADAVGNGLRQIRQQLDQRVDKRRLTPSERDVRMSMVSPTVDYSGFRDADVVIEAVFEDIELKRNVLRDIEGAGRADVVFASNTSTIPISKIAEASKHPETVIGMHYFSPVPKMPLLEVIVTDKTAPWVVATCVELGKRQGKTVIVVRDGVGFYTSRILGPYMFEAFNLLGEGVPIEAIDDALVKWGFPVGPVKLLDEVGIDVAHKVSKVVGRPDERLEKLIADERYGRKNARGFYLYGGGKKKGVDPSVYQTLGVEPKNQMPPEEIALRCVLLMVNEAARCFGEGILRSARDGDIGAVFGLGFPPFRGGPFRFADTLGIRAVVDRLHGWEREHGDRFTPARTLIELGEKRASFYGENGQAKAVPGAA